MEHVCYWKDAMKEMYTTSESETPFHNRCTIVTCYYRSRAKHSNQSYDTWMTNFLGTIDNEMVIFCDEASVAKIIELRKSFINKTKIYILPLHETYCGHDSYRSIWEKDWQRDRERMIHNINLYIIWNEKSMFVQRAMTINPFQTEFFMWCDIGCFRSSEDISLFQKEWPAQEFLQTVRKDKMYFLNIEPFQREDFTIQPNGLPKTFEYVNRIGGTIFFGHKDIFRTWIETYYSYMNEYIEKDYFAGKDQNIIASIYVLHPELFQLVKPVAGEGDPWFYLQRYFLKST